MPSYVTPKKNTAFIIYTSLVSQADTKLLKSGPTLAAGDFKVSIDGGAFANLTTLPTNTPSGVLVKVSLSSSEMNGDNISVACIDAAGAEWCDQLLNIQTSARQIDDLAYPATSGRSMVVDASGLVDANAVKIGPTGSGTAQTARDIGASVLLSSGSGTGQVGLSSGAISNVLTVVNSVVVSTNNDKTGYTLSSAGVQAIWDALTSALTTAGSIGKRIVDYLTGDIYARLGAPAGASVSADVAAVKVDTAAIKAKTDNLPAAPAAVGDIPTANQNADALLKRDWTSVTGEAARSALNALRFLRNKWSLASGTLTVTTEDDSTAAWTGAVTTDAAAVPVTGNDPA